MMFSNIFKKRFQSNLTKAFNFSKLMLSFFLLVVKINFAQQTLVKSFSSDATSIEISTFGLDEIKITNSENDEVEVHLLDENLHAHHIIVNEKASILKVKFKLDFFENDKVFKKFITQRLNRASVLVKLPQNRNLTILGTNIDVISKSYNGNLYIYVDKGLVNLNEVQKNADIKLFQGNIFATLSNSSIDIQSSKGKILINEKFHKKKYQKKLKNSKKAFQISSINANVNCEIKK